MADPLLRALQPEQISGLLGRWPPDSTGEKNAGRKDAPLIKRIRPRTRFLVIGLAVVALFLVVAAVEHGLTSPGVPTALSLVTHSAGKPARIGFPLLQDPVGIIAIAMTLATPILCAEQIKAIRVFNETNERNIAYRVRRLDSGRIDNHTRWANGKFAGVGSRAGSAVILLVGACASLGIDYLFGRWKLLAGWNHTSLPRNVWSQRVYDGWWANPHAHPVLAIALWLLGCYFFYFLIKQLLMGAVFAIYVQRIMPLDFGVAPNLSANTDGHWGLRPMRIFMQATYGSVLGHTIMIIGILVVWLPFGVFTILMVTAVIIINALLVIYPSAVGHTGAIREKILFVQDWLIPSQLPLATKDELIDRVWTTPTLPFRLRSTLTASTIYLIIPVLLAVVSSLLSR